MLVNAYRNYKAEVRMMITLGILLGLFGGILFNRLAKLQISNRSDDKTVALRLDNPALIICTGIICASVCGFISFGSTNVAYTLFCIMTVLVASSIAVVDALIRKIPNESLLLLIVLKFAAITVNLVNGVGIYESVIIPLIGFAVGSLIYLIPSLFHIPIGAGDIKYCAVIGLQLGLYGFLQTSVIMAAALLIYLIYLLITKKGNIKTAAPMGPFLSLGVVVTLIIPLTDIIK